MWIADYGLRIADCLIAGRATPQPRGSGQAAGNGQWADRAGDPRQMPPGRVFVDKVWPAVWGFFSRFFILAGLSLLAWGLDDLAGFFSSPVRAGFVAVVAVSGLLLAGLAFVTPPQPEREEGEPHDPTNWSAHISEGIYLAVAYGDRRDVLTWADEPALRWIGLAIYLVGIGLSLWANITWVNHLRREAGRACEDPVLLAEGPFRLIRYPGLLWLVFYCLGSAVMFRSWIGLVLLIPLVTSIAGRIHDRERAFAERYPQAWPMRSHTSKRIIPLVY